MVLFQILNTTSKSFSATRTKKHRTVLVRDICGTESGYSLDTHGFEVFTLSKKDGDSPNNDTGDSEYFDEVSDMIKAAFVSHLSDLLHAKVENTSTGAKNVIIFAKVIRRLRRDALKAREFEGAKVQAPSPRSHVDFAQDNAELQACRMVPGGADLVRNSTRWQLLGVWRLIKPVQRDPLVLTDSRSVPDSDNRDLSRDKTWGPEAKMVMCMLKHGNEKEHQWHYWSDMTPEEVLLFKHFDSKKDIPAWRRGHTSIEIPGTENLPPRESIEVRALVGY